MLACKNCGVRAKAPRKITELLQNNVIESDIQRPRPQSNKFFRWSSQAQPVGRPPHAILIRNLIKFKEILIIM